MLDGYGESHHQKRPRALIRRSWTGVQAVLPDARDQRSQGTTTEGSYAWPTSTQQPTLLDHVRQVLRLHHYSMHTERSSVEWIMRFVRFHRLRSREDLFPTECRSRRP